MMNKRNQQTSECHQDKGDIPAARLWAIAYRYVGLGILLIVLLSVLFLVALHLDLLPSVSQNVFLTFLALTVLFTCIFSFLLKGRGTFMPAASIWLVYPPAVAVALIVLVVIGALLYLQKPSYLSPYFLSVFTMSLAVPLAWCCLSWSGKDRMNEPESENHKLPEGFEWIERENPIDDETEDKFDHRYLARRLADLLQEGRCKSFGLSGLHGSGKTSVMKMVEDCCREKEQPIWFAYVKGWGQSKDLLPKLVLESVVRCLREHGVDTLALESWPSDYMREIIGRQNWVCRLLGMSLGRQQDSKAVLSRIDPVLTAIGRRVIVVIEDVDRNSPDEQDMRLLFHLLDEFDQAQNISFFFLKSSNTPIDVDFHRLCEHTESVPEISEEMLRSILKDFLDCCANYANVQLLNPDRLDIANLGISFTKGEAREGVDVESRFFSSIASTPRVVKQFLRRAWMVWENLCGEVDLLELLVWSLLREGCPEGYSFLKRKIRSLRNLPDSLQIADKQPSARLLAIHKEIDELSLKEQEDAFKAALVLCGFKLSIFKKEYIEIVINRDKFPRNIGSEYPPAYQSISDDRASDYLQRLEAGVLRENEIEDQEVVSSIKQYLGDRNRALPMMIAKDDIWGKKVIQFQDLLSNDCIVDLAVDHVRECVDLYGSKADDSSSSFLSIEKLVESRYETRENLESRIEEMLITALRKSLEMAHVIYFRYGSSRSPVLQLALRKSWVNYLRSKLRAGKVKLADIVNPETPYSLYHTMRFRGDYPVYNTAEEWRWIVPFLIKEMKECPEKLCPDVAKLFIKDMRNERRGEGEPFDFDHDYFAKLCTTRSERSEIASALQDYGKQHSPNDMICQMITYLEDVLDKYITDVNDHNIQGTKIYEKPEQ